MVIASPIVRSALETRDLTEAHDALSRRFVDYRGQVIDAREFVFRHRGASVGGLALDTVLYRVVMESVAEPFVPITVVSLDRGRFAVGAGRARYRVPRGGSALYPPRQKLSFACDRVLLRVVQFPGEVAAAIAGRVGVGRADLRFAAPEPISEAMNRHWLSTVAYLSRSFAGPDPAVAYPLILNSTIEAAATAALATFPNSTMAVDYVAGPGYVASAAVRRAVAFVDAHAGDPLTVEDVAAASGLGVRGLQAAFARHLDTTPMLYLRRVRLERAHRELQAGDPALGHTVAVIGRRWGFGNLSRFAAEYRKAYGQTPSRTLRM